MILITSSKAKRLLMVRYVGHVRLADFQRNEPEMLAQMQELSPGFVLFGDFSQLDQMDRECAAELGRMMERLVERGVELIVRLMPDARKDIGLNILGAFHYPRNVKVVTCKTMAEVGEELKLG